jgi:hypothetical protein
VANVPHGARTATAYLATAGVALLSLAALNIAADRLPFKGLHALRGYVTNSPTSAK